GGFSMTVSGPSEPNYEQICRSDWARAYFACRMCLCARTCLVGRLRHNETKFMGDNDEGFFAQLAELTSFEDVVSTAHHRPAPETWHVVVTDVAGSTDAIEKGHYKDVNAVGVASILALRNALPDVELPYVFGGDGATILVPGNRIAQVDTALRGMRNVAQEAFSLTLRASHVPVARLTQFGHPFLVGRYRLSPHVVLAAFSGRGVSVVEQWVKDPDLGKQFSVSDDGPAEADLEGFECR